MKVLKYVMLGLMSFALSGVVLSADHAAPAPPQPAATTKSSSAPSAVARWFAQSVVLQGMLGDEPIQMQLQPKTDVEDSVKGDYFIFGSPQKILVAGEYQDEGLSLEESVNGVDVSGQWDGDLKGNTLRGTWWSDDRTINKPFVLHIAMAKEAKASQPGHAAANNAAKTAVKEASSKGAP